MARALARCLICRRRIWPWERQRLSQVLQKPMHVACADRYIRVRWSGEPEEETWTGV